MLRSLKIWSQQRSGWILIILSGLCLEGAALYFQHGMGLQPCVMCIYERVALSGIILSAFIATLYPKSLIIRLLSIALGLWAAIKGLLLATKHVDYQFNPAPWNQCEFLVNFPPTLPLNKWFPQVFEATGSCSNIDWLFLGCSMPQWLIFIFSVYIFIFVIVLISQFKRTASNRHRNLFR